MGKTWGKAIGVFTILSGLSGVVAVADWLNLSNNWRFAIAGFILGTMITLIFAIVMWDSPYRHAKLERERKKEELVQQLPSRQERLDELAIALDELELEISVLDAEAQQQRDIFDSVFSQGPELIRQSSRATAEKKDRESKSKKPAVERFAKEQDRIISLTDDEWRAEQEAKIYVPD